eukprot:4985261-Amphidinium_carterae.1
MRDPPPAWDGEEPAKRWRNYRRDLKMWESSTDIGPLKRGSLVFRAFTGKARILAEGLEDRVIQAEDG